MSVCIRPLSQEYAWQISRVAEACVGPSPMGVRTYFEVDAYTVFTRHPDTRGLVACGQDGQVVGYSFFRPVTIRLNGNPVKALFRFNTAVDPSSRRKGVGGQLVRAVHAQALARHIPVVFCDVEVANAPQKGNLAKVGEQITGSFQRTLSLVCRQPPRIPQGVKMRLAEPADLSRWALEANSFYRDQNFWQPLSGDQLAEWQSVDGRGLRRGFCQAENGQGEPLAGLGFDDCNSLFTWGLVPARPLVRLAGRVIKMVDPHGRIPHARIMAPWFREGYASVARSLWVWLRWHLRNTNTLLVAYYDTSGPVGEMVTRSRYLPVTRVLRYARADFPITCQHPVAPDVF